MTESVTTSEDNHQPAKEKGFTIRAILLSIVLNMTFTLVGTYLGISLGVGFSLSAVNVLIAYGILKNVKIQEITFVTIAGQAYSVYWLASMGIFLRMQHDVHLPTWLVPSQEVLINGGIFCKAWILPILSITFLTMVGVVLSLIMGILVADKVLEKKEMKFPMFQVTGTTINAIAGNEHNDNGTKKAKSHVLFKWMGIGGGLVALQVLLSQVGIPAQTIDFTVFFKQYGTAFALNLMLVFVGIGIIISPKVSLTTLGTGLFVYLGLLPLLKIFGFLQPPQSAYIPLPGQTVILHFYNWLLFNVLLSPALGIAILGPVFSGLIGILLKKIKNKGKKETQTENTDNLGFLEFMKALILGFKENKIAAFLFLGLTGASFGFILGASIFDLSIWKTIGLAVLIITMGFIDSWIMIRMMGEMGMTMGMYRVVFYETPLAMSGVRNWTGYLAYPNVNPWSGGGIIGFTKVARMTKTKKETIIKAYLLRLIPGIAVGTLTTLLLWYLFSFPSPEIPGVPLYRNYLLLRIFVQGEVKGVVKPFLLLISGVISGALGFVTPISIMGLSFGMFLPISYIFPIGIGGVIRYLLNKKKGDDWFKAKGRVMVSGFIAGATISQIFTSVFFLFL